MKRHPLGTRTPLAAAVLLLTSCGDGGTDPGDQPASITLSSANVDLASLRATFDLDATVRDAGGSTISADVSWSSRAWAVATVSSTGVITAVGNGTTQVIATAGTVQDTALVTVQQVAATLLLAPDTLRFSSAGDTATITPTVRDSGGSAMTGVSVTFTASDAGVAIVNGSSGRVTAQGDGAAHVTGQVAPGGAPLTGSVRVEVGGILAPAYLVGGYSGTAYADQIGPAIGSGGDFTYIVSRGGLPAGLSLNPANAQITGAPSPFVFPGVYFFEVRATNGMLTVTQSYVITISTKPPERFNLWVAWNGGPLPNGNTSDALRVALARWEEIVSEDAGPAVTFPSSGLVTGRDCRQVNGELLNGAFVDDVAIVMAVGPIDGPYNTVARGGPCAYTRQQRPVVISGQVILDVDDAVTHPAAFLEDVIWHEIAHVVGVGTLWQDSLRFVATDSVRYYGVNGNAQWRTLGGLEDGVPVQRQFEGHWDEAWFEAEIMTPSAEGTNVTHPISRLTIGALLDLGWSAVLEKAEPYILPGCRPACTAPARAVSAGSGPTDDVVIERLRPLPPEALRH